MVRRGTKRSTVRSALLALVVGATILSTTMTAAQPFSRRQEASNTTMPPPTEQQGGSTLNDTQTATDLPPYRDATLCIEQRVDDLVSRMTLEEKAGQMFHGRLYMGPNGTLNGAAPDGSYKATVDYLQSSLMTHFNLASSIENVADAVNWANAMQKAASETRLGIPVTISTDPRHAFTDNVGTGFSASAFSQWPEALGLAALRDPKRTYSFAQVAAEEYKAVGLRLALHPQVDLSTEPRWGRISGTFGEDSNLTSSLVVEYIRGFQGDEFGPNSVSTVTKHFPGSGPVRAGNDSHFPTGKDAVYTNGGDMLDYHLAPFKAAIKAGARQMMPYYSRPVGLSYEEVGAGLNRGIVTDLLRNQLGFNDGVVLSDWGLITPFSVTGEDLEPIAWGAENLTQAERLKKVLDAGTDQLGGETRPELLVELVRNGTIPESRLDVSVRRLMREKFTLGLFENPLVEVEQAERIVGNPYFRRLGDEAQRDAYTLLKNEDGLLPLRSNSQIKRGGNGGTKSKVYVEGFDPANLEPYGVDRAATPEEADLAILRLTTPFEKRGGAFQQRYKQGSLAFNQSEVARQEAIFATVPSVVSITLDRPAVVPHLGRGGKNKALLGDYGSGPFAMLDVIFGTATQGKGTYKGPKGRLPFDLPSSMEEVERQKEDVPFDTRNPTYKFGEGIMGYGKEGAEECSASSSS